MHAHAWLHSLAMLSSYILGNAIRPGICAASLAVWALHHALKDAHAGWESRRGKATQQALGYLLLSGPPK